MIIGLGLRCHNLVNLEIGEDSWPTFINGLLELELQVEIVKLLKEFEDCFAWDYHEMPGLDRKLVE